MEQRAVAAQDETLREPQKIWQTLTATQQQAVLQAMVRVCQHLLAQSQEGVEDEPDAND